MGIGEFIKDLWRFFCPPDPPITDLMGEEATMGKAEGHLRSLYSWMFRISLTVMTLSTFTLAVLFTPWRPVTASDVESKVKTQVEASIKDLKAEQKQIREDVTLIKSQSALTSMAVSEILKTSVATNICRLIARRQKETDYSERAALRNDIDTEQNKYKAVATEFYPESRCGGGL